MSVNQKTAFLFPGQGSQFVGMGNDLYQNYESVKKLYDLAEEILDFQIKRISFEGPEDELRQTQFTQPAIFLHSLAINKLLEQEGIIPRAVAGHSLGEYSALVAAKYLTFEDGLRLVKLRGELMSYSGSKNPGTMAAIIGLSEEEVMKICSLAGKFGIVQPANFNSPGQIVISGSVEGVHKAMEIAKEKNARMVTELVVSGAFHSPLMREALEGLTKALKETNIQDSNIPVYANVTGKPTRSANEIRDLLQKQLMSPVLWQKIILNFIQDGYTQFIEAGPSKVLTGLSKRITRDFPCIPIGNNEDLAKIKEGN
jgi:[acyl-carrier-protein] S-malonyltransferase